MAYGIFVFEENGDVGDDQATHSVSFEPLNGNLHLNPILGIRFSTFFTSEGLDERREEREVLILTRLKEQLLFVRSNQEYFSKKTQGDSKSELIDKAFSQNEGTFFIPSSPLFRDRKVVIWMRHLEANGRGSYISVLVCETIENVIAACNFLKLLPVLLEQIANMKDLHDNSRKIYIKKDLGLIREFPDYMLSVLHYFLPGGLLLFLTPDAVDSLLIKARHELFDSASGS